MMKKWLIFACTIASSVLAEGLFSPENLSVDDAQGLRTASGLKKEKDPYDLNVQSEEKDSVAPAQKISKPGNEQKSGSKEMSTTESILSFFRPQSKKKNTPQPEEDAAGTADKVKKKLDDGKKKISHKTKEAKKKAKTDKNAQKAMDTLSEKKEQAKEKAIKAKEKTKQFVSGKKQDIKRKHRDEKLKQKEEKLKENEEQAKISSKAHSSDTAAASSKSSTRTSTATQTSTSSPSPTSSLVDSVATNKKEGAKPGSGSTKTVTITEIRIVTVYKEKSPRPTPDVGGLFSERAPNRKSVYIASQPRDEYEGEQIAETKEKEIKTLRDQKKKIQGQIHQLEEKIASLEVEIAVTTKDTELRKKIVKEKEKEYEQQKSQFLSNKSSSEKKIGSEMKALEGNKEKSAKTKESKKEAEMKMESLKKEHSQISKQAKNFKPEKSKTVPQEEGVGKKTLNKIKDTMSSISKAAAPHSGTPEKAKHSEKASEKPAAGKTGSISPHEKSSVPVSGPEAHKSAEGAAKQDSHQHSGTLKSVGGVTCEMPSAESPKVEVQQKNPLKEGKKEEGGAHSVQIAPFAQNFSNGHLVVSGSPISADPKVIAKTQQLFNKSLEKAAEKSKGGDKILAFWGYITSLLSPEK